MNRTCEKETLEISDSLPIKHQHPHQTWACPPLWCFCHQTEAASYCPHRWTDSTSLGQVWSAGILGVGSRRWCGRRWGSACHRCKWCKDRWSLEWTPEYLGWSPHRCWCRSFHPLHHLRVGQTRNYSACVNWLINTNNKRPVFSLLFSQQDQWLAGHILVPTLIKQEKQTIYALHVQSYHTIFKSTKWKTEIEWQRNSVDMQSNTKPRFFLICRQVREREWIQTLLHSNDPVTLRKGQGSWNWHQNAVLNGNY